MWLLTAVQAAIVRKCQSGRRPLRSGWLEFRGAMRSGSNLTPHTPSRLYQRRVEVQQLRGALIFRRPFAAAPGAAEQEANGAEIFRLMVSPRSVLSGD